MRESEKYLRIVEWSEEDRCFVGRCPDLMFGGVHGPDERRVFAELCEVIEEWVATSKERNEALPPGLAGKEYSGKFNLRLGRPLHERLALESAIQAGHVGAKRHPAVAEGTTPSFKDSRHPYYVKCKMTKTLINQCINVLFHTRQEPQQLLC